MAKDRDSARERAIENFSFYTFGRVEREIEALAQRIGISAGDLTSRVSALLPVTPNGSVLGSESHLPALPDDTTTRMPLDQPTLALAGDARSLRVHHEAKSNIARGKENRSNMLGLLATLEPPVTSLDLTGLARERFGMNYSTTKQCLEKMVRDRLLVKKGKQFRWDKKLLAGSESPAGVSVLHKQNQKPKLKKYADLLLDAVQELGGRVRKDNLWRTLRTHYPNIVLKRWQNIIPKLVVKGFLTNENGELTLQKSPAGVPVPQKTKQDQEPRAKGKRPKDIVLKFMKKRQLSQAAICQALRKKHPDYHQYTWNPTVTTLVRSGQLTRWANGLITAKNPSAEGTHGKPTTAAG